MQVSCKVSYSILVYIERQGAQLDGFFENFHTPVEFLKDTAAWLDLDEMENFLCLVTQFIGEEKPEQLLREIGHSNFDLRAWGVLDSVLKMVETPKDIFEQPERFLSYFLTPPPPMDVEKIEDHRVTFQVGGEIKAKLLFSYLVGAVEGLPLYMGMPLAKIDQGPDQSFIIAWFDDQQSLFDEQEKKRRQFHPEIVQSVIQSIQNNKETLKGTNVGSNSPAHVASDAFEKMVALEVEKRMALWVARKKDFEDSFFKIKNDFYKMYDYFTRAQQIITLISPTARKASVREAQRRVDWEHIQREFPAMVESACDSILELKQAFQINLDDNAAGDIIDLEEVNLNELIDSVVEDLGSEDRSLEVDKQWLFDKKIMLNKNSFVSALADVFNNSLANSPKQAQVRIVTRPKGAKVLVEIQDRSLGLSDEKLKSIFSEDSENSLKISQEIIQRHRGQLSVSSRQGEGSTYTIELPY